MVGLTPPRGLLPEDLEKSEKRSGKVVSGVMARRWKNNIHYTHTHTYTHQASIQVEKKHTPIYVAR